MPPGVAAGSTSREAAHFSRHIQDSTRTICTCVGKGPGIWRSALFRDGGSVQGSYVFIFGDADSDTDEVSAPLCLQHDCFDGVSRHPLDACQKLPLIRIGPKFCINKNTVPVCARELLQRKGDQVAKPSFGHRVLVGKESVIGIQSYLVAGLHGSSENCTAKFSRGCSAGLLDQRISTHGRRFLIVSVPVPLAH